MKTHINFRTSDIKKSVAYYRTLLNATPAKQYDDYALFLVEDPGIELALDRAAQVSLGESAHYGIVVDSSDLVDATAERLRTAGVQTKLETEETCCYAKQTKVWSSDPDGRAWEVYTVLEETTERDDPASTCCDDGARDAACC